VDKKPKRWDMNLHEAYLAKATELLAKAKVTRRDSDKANFERIAEIYFRLAAKAKRVSWKYNQTSQKIPIKKIGRKRSSTPVRLRFFNCCRDDLSALTD